jgi:hypothetical protein
MNFKSSNLAIRFLFLTISIISVLFLIFVSLVLSFSWNTGFWTGNLTGCLVLGIVLTSISIIGCYCYNLLFYKNRLFTICVYSAFLASAILSIAMHSPFNWGQSLYVIVPLLTEFFRWRLLA